MNIHLRVFVWAYILISLEYIPKSGIAVSYDKLVQNLQVLLERTASFCIPRQRMRVPVSHIFANICFSSVFFLIMTILVSVK